MVSNAWKNPLRGFGSKSISRRIRDAALDDASERRTR
jgi:hypothetical protein